MKKLLALSLALVMVFALVACGNGQTTGTPSTPTSPSSPSGSGTSATTPPADDDPFADMKEITLIYSSTKNEKADAAQLAYLENITNATGGKVKWDVYLSNSLITSTRDIPEGVSGGIADVATLNINNYTSIFPLNYNVLSTPFTGVTDACRLDIMTYMYDKYPELDQEFTNAGLKRIGWSLTNSNNMGVKLGKAYSSIADVKNIKITGSSEVVIDILAAAGAVPVTVAFPEIYQSLEKNVINGFVNHSAPAFAMSFHEHIDNWIVFGEGSGICVDLVAVVMGLDKWNSLPAAVQEVFLAAEPERAVAEAGTQRNFDNMLKKTVQEAGKHYVVLDEQQLAEWMPFVQPVVNQILKDMEASHPGFGAMYDDLCDYVANYDK